MATRIDEIEGIGPVYAARLAIAGVDTIEDLLIAGGTTVERVRLAATTGIDEHRLLTWVNNADLMRVKGVGSEYAELLEAAGVDSATELATRRADNLQAKMAEVNETRKLVRRVPTMPEIERWIVYAKGLEKVVTH